MAHLNFHISHKQFRERTSPFTSKGSMTIEAALVTPLFFFAAVCLVYLLEMMAIRTTITNALASVGREMAKEAYVSQVLVSSRLEEKIIDNVGIERLGRSIIQNGADGIDCSRSKINWGSGVLELSAAYKIKLPIWGTVLPAISCEETLRMKGWNGYQSAFTLPSGEERVYITEYGLVYHKRLDCTYLNPSIQTIKFSEIEDKRNDSGGKYYLCESCGKKEKETAVVFITTYGTRYHVSLACKKIKRNIYVIPLEEAYGLGGCSKCCQ